MFPNISYSTGNGNPTTAEPSMLSDYQNYISQLNSSIFASHQLQLLQKTSSQNNKSNSKQQQQRDISSSCSSASSTSSCSSTSSSTNHHQPFLPSLTNPALPVAPRMSPNTALPPIFNHSSPTTTATSSLLSSFKHLNPAALSMANEYLNTYLLSFGQQQQTLLNIHIDKRLAKTSAIKRMTKHSRVCSYSLARFLATEHLPILITNYTFQPQATQRIFFVFPVFSAMDHLLGYLDMNHSSSESTPDNHLLYLLNKTTFAPSNYNCIIQPSQLGNSLELIAIKDIQANQELVCWFSESYLKNIKSKNTIYCHTNGN